MREILTFHGILGLIRMLLTPVIFYLILAGSNLLAGILFLIASSTDFIDGLLVKEHKHNVEFSYFWDGFADRILIFPVLIALIIRGLSFFALSIIIIYAVAEILIGILMTIKMKKFYLYHKHRFSARINVIIILALMSIFIIVNDYEILLALIASPFLIYMGLDYFVHYIRNV